MKTLAAILSLAVLASCSSTGSRGIVGPLALTVLQNELSAASMDLSNAAMVMDDPDRRESLLDLAAHIESAHRLLVSGITANPGGLPSSMREVLVSLRTTAQFYFDTYASDMSDDARLSFILGLAALNRALIYTE